MRDRSFFVSWDELLDFAERGGGVCYQNSKRTVIKHSESLACKHYRQRRRLTEKKTASV